MTTDLGLKTDTKPPEINKRPFSLPLELPASSLNTSTSTQERERVPRSLSQTIGYPNVV